MSIKLVTVAENLLESLTTDEVDKLVEILVYFNS